MTAEKKSLHQKQGKTIEQRTAAVLHQANTRKMRFMMNDKRIDLHVHSSCSDGTLSPRKLVAYAAEKGLAAIALTDHDTICGIPSAMEAAAHYHLELIPGLEFSTNYNNIDIHVLGLDIPWQNPEFIRDLKAFQDSRDIRNRKMIARLQEHGIDITWEKMAADNPDSVWTRANFARYLLDHRYVRSMPDAFARYIGDQAPCFVPREKVTPCQAVDLIHRYGGFAVLAHPMLYHLSDEGLEELTLSLKLHDLDGVEAIYSTYRWMDESRVKQLARKYSLCITGGSDFHGSNKPDIDLGVGRGNLKIPYELWTNLKNHIVWH